MGNSQQKLAQNSGQSTQEEEAADNHSTFTCEICIEPMLSPTQKFKTSSKCTHPFCTDCMIKYIQVKIDENLPNIKCPALNCEHFFDPLSCKAVLPPELFDKWCDVLCDSAILGFERSYCPNQDCSALILNECGGSVKKSACPICKRLFCFRCKLPWHAGFQCEESRELRDANDVAFGVLVERQKWIRCPQCQRFIERIDGCPIMKCRVTLSSHQILYNSDYYGLVEARNFVSQSRKRQIKDVSKGKEGEISVNEVLYVNPQIEIGTTHKSFRNFIFT
ncbi:hypothetical protein RJ640_017116 [Escallonia rubra]|uniref:RBR-type E3 ubiquitin transferase n=1 Tax=Escallonia rubra TaxID=112253 RepID=A0AA88RQS7_9ASTE|nr:hypothetical protein RJ640_017116 [Escallonia rubra]